MLLAIAITYLIRALCHTKSFLNAQAPAPEFTRYVETELNLMAFINKILSM